MLNTEQTVNKKKKGIHSVSYLPLFFFLSRNPDRKYSFFYNKPLLKIQHVIISDVIISDVIDHGDFCSTK